MKLIAGALLAILPRKPREPYGLIVRASTTVENYKKIIICGKNHYQHFIITMMTQNKAYRLNRNNEN